MWPLLSGGQATTVGVHDAPVKEVAWIPEMNMLVTGSWDKTLRCVLLLVAGTRVAFRLLWFLDSISVFQVLGLASAECCPYSNTSGAMLCVEREAPPDGGCDR